MDNLALLVLEDELTKDAPVPVVSWYDSHEIGSKDWEMFRPRSCLVRVIDDKADAFTMEIQGQDVEEICKESINKTTRDAITRGQVLFACCSKGPSLSNLEKVNLAISVHIRVSNGSEGYKAEVFCAGSLIGKMNSDLEPYWLKHENHIKQNGEFVAFLGHPKIVDQNHSIDITASDLQNLVPAQRSKVKIQNVDRRKSALLVLVQEEVASQADQTTGSLMTIPMDPFLGNLLREGLTVDAQVGKHNNQNSLWKVVAFDEKSWLQVSRAMARSPSSSTEEKSIAIREWFEFIPDKVRGIPNANEPACREFCRFLLDEFEKPDLKFEWLRELAAALFAVRFHVDEHSRAHDIFLKLAWKYRQDSDEVVLRTARALLQRAITLMDFEDIPKLVNFLNLSMSGNKIDFRLGVLVRIEPILRKNPCLITPEHQEWVDIVAKIANDMVDLPENSTGVESSIATLSVQVLGLVGFQGVEQLVEKTQERTEFTSARVRLKELESVWSETIREWSLEGKKHPEKPIAFLQSLVLKIQRGKNGSPL